MSEQIPPGVVVVGVDTSPDSDRALHWALAHASRTRQLLRLVHVTPRMSGAREADAVLEHALSAIADHDGIGGVTTERIDEALLGPGEVLLQATGDASMLVLGAGGQAGTTGSRIGSTSQYTTRYATCPVVTVRPAADAGAARILVGVDDSDGAQDALSFTFEVAAPRGVGVTAIHVWQPVGSQAPGAVRRMPGDVGAQLAEADRLLGGWLWPWQQKYPEVPVTAEVIPGRPDPVLTHASDHAALVVVGARGGAAVSGPLRGSVSQDVLRHARCPVAVAH